jgi:hypothetical protein
MRRKAGLPALIKNETAERPGRPATPMRVTLKQMEKVSKAAYPARLGKGD